MARLMGLPDPHDKRLFTHFAKLNPDGTVAAIVEVADASLPLSHPSDDGGIYVDVTALRAQQIDVYGLTVSKAAMEAAATAPRRDQAVLTAVFHADALALAEADAEIPQ